MVAKPDPGTFQVLPGRGDGGVARMFCDVLTPEGEPFDGDPRWVLRRNLERAAGRGFTVYVAPELEFFLFADAESGRPLDIGSYFDQTALDLSQDFRRIAIAMLERMGISVMQSHHEIAPSQHEIDLREADALTMADNVMSARLVVKEAALEQGLHATFMPKPREGVAGSGMDTHLSLYEGDRNAFYDPGPGGQPVQDGPQLHRRAAGPRARVHRRDQPVDQLLQAAGARLRRPHLHLLGPAQPLGHGQGGRLPVRPGRRRGPLARPGGQPLPGLRGAAGRRHEGHRGGVRAAPGGRRQPPGDDRGRAPRRRDPLAPGRPARGPHRHGAVRAGRRGPRRARLRVLPAQQAPRLGQLPALRLARSSGTATCRCCRRWPVSLSALARLGFEEPEAAAADLERLGAWPPAAAPGGNRLRADIAASAAPQLAARSLAALAAAHPDPDRLHRPAAAPASASAAASSPWSRPAGRSGRGWPPTPPRPTGWPTAGGFAAPRPRAELVAEAVARGRRRRRPGGRLGRPAAVQAPRAAAGGRARPGRPGRGRGDRGRAGRPGRRLPGGRPGGGGRRVRLRPAADAPGRARHGQARRDRAQLRVRHRRAVLPRAGRRGRAGGGRPGGRAGGQGGHARAVGGDLRGDLLRGRRQPASRGPQRAAVADPWQLPGLLGPLGPAVGAARP